MCRSWMLLFRAPETLNVRSENEPEVGKKTGDLAMIWKEWHQEYEHLKAKRNRTASEDWKNLEQKLIRVLKV